MKKEEWYFCSKCLHRARYQAMGANRIRNELHIHKVQKLDKVFHSCSEKFTDQIPEVASEFESRYLIHFNPAAEVEDEIEERDPRRM